MRRGMPAGVVCIAILAAAVQCRTTRSNEGASPAETAGGPVQDGAGAGSGPAAAVPARVDGTAATAGSVPVAPVAMPRAVSASWGEAAAKFAQCPRPLCGTGSAGSVRGCESSGDRPGSLAAEVASPPEPFLVGNHGPNCGGGSYRGSGGGRGQGALGVATGGRTARQAYAAGPAMAPPPARPAQPSVPATTTAMPVEEMADGDELVVFERAESESRGDRGRRNAEADDRAGDAGAEAAAAPPTQGTLHAKRADGEALGEFPLQHTEVAAEVSGYIAKTVVLQQYANPFEEVIEAVYVFPLPGMSAINDFVMEVGSRRIVGVVRPREEAERIYAAARARGQTASLLTQERSNIFTQSVANIEPGGRVDIRITYFEKLAYEGGRYEYMFPMVVGPRYVPGSPAGRESTTTPTTGGGGGWSPPTDRVPDADRITPPVLRPGERSGHDIGLSLVIDAGLPITDLAPVTHCVDVEEHGSGRRVLKLSAGDSIPNRDFVVRWSVSGAETQFGVLAHRGDAGGFLTLMMQPPAAPTDEQVSPRELTFLIDISGSMSGLPLGIAKEIVVRTLDDLRPEDAFNIVYFASGNGQLWESPRPRTPANVREAKEYIEGMCAGGGTEMLEGLRRALSARHDPQYLQMYVFLTDGYIGNENEILRMVKEDRGEARFFAFGIGSSINRMLIDGIGEHGGGASEAVLPRDPEHAGKAVARLFDLIDSPVLVDVTVDWNGLPVADVYPARLPDLFAGQTINLVARYTAPAQGTAYVEARVGTRRLRLPVQVVLPEREAANEALAPIWARWRIEDWMKEMPTATESRAAAIKQQVTDLAVEFRLMSSFTAFVAVDESRVVGDGSPLRVLQPVELPEGVSYEGVFGEQGRGAVVEIPGWGLQLQMTESGRVRVGAVRHGSPADQAGLEAGATLRTVNGTLVHDLGHFEGLVLQSPGGVRLGIDGGGEITLSVP